MILNQLVIFGWKEYGLAHCRAPWKFLPTGRNFSRFCW